MITETVETIYTCECKRSFKRKDHAEACGQCSRCKTYAGTRHHYSITYETADVKFWAEECKPCAELSRAERSAEYIKKTIDKMAKAVEIPYAENPGIGWVYCEDIEGSNNGFYESIDELADYVFDDKEEHPFGKMPEFVYATTPIHLSLDADSILESALSNHYEDAFDDVDSTGLQVVLDEWVAKQTLISFESDETKKIRTAGNYGTVLSSDKE